uniref:MULE transposase domain-containing protein n=1 Tax=Trichogramma kaykai TaxID=54128 RepID=A0ABD2WAB1_9HYME
MFQTISTRVNFYIRVLRYYKCATNGCNATAQMVEGIDKLVPIKPHHITSCPSQKKEDTIIEIEEWLKEKLTDRYWKFNDLWKEANKKYPEAECFINVIPITSKLKKWRSTKFPVKAKDMAQFINQINNEEYNLILNYEEHKVSAIPVEDTDKFKHVLLYDSEFVQQNFENCTHLFIDATFKSRPSLSDCLQLLIVMGVLSGHAVPLFYVPMSRKTKAAYESVFNQILRVHDFKNVKIIMSDFEWPLRNAIKSCFSIGTAVGLEDYDVDKEISTSEEALRVEKRQRNALKRAKKRLDEHGIQYSCSKLT